MVKAELRDVRILENVKGVGLYQNMQRKLNIIIDQVTVTLNSEDRTVELSKIFDDTIEKPGCQVSLLLTYAEFVGIVRSLNMCYNHGEMVL